MCATAAKVVWQIGVADNSGTELALGPSEYKKFLAHDFGYEDRYFLVGTSVDKNDFPYVLPGPDDTWGGTWSTSGWRTHDAKYIDLALKNCRTWQMEIGGRLGGCQSEPFGG